MQGLVIAATTHRALTHAAFADDEADAGLRDKLLLELLHAHGGRRADRDHLVFLLAERADDRTSMEDSSVLDIDGQVAPFLDDAAVGHIAAGRQQSRQVDDVADMDIFEIFCADWRRKYFLGH